MEKQSVEYDAIIVGLGCFGLGAAYIMSREGLKVLGFDKAHSPGVIGSGSIGTGRIWRYLHTEERYCDMQKEAEEVFKELGKKTGKDYLPKQGLLYVKKVGHPELEEIQKYGERLSAAQMRQRWPALVVPDYLEGVFTHDAGVAKARESLEDFRDQARVNGADLRYSTAVAHVNHEKGIVTLESGEQFRAKNIVVTCGATTDQFYQFNGQFKARKQLIHCYYLKDNLNLPPAFLIEDLEEANGIMVFGTLDGDNFSTYKVGNELEDADPHLMLKIMKVLLPSKIERIDHVQTCYYSMSHDDEFIFEKKGKTVYGFGCNGRGFKHMPYHGKRIYNLVVGNQKEADKYKKVQPKLSPEPIAKL